jgi:hypothetical protein
MKASSSDRVVGWAWHIAELFDPDHGLCDSQAAKKAKKEALSLNHARQ